MEEVTALKQQAGKGLILLAGAEIARILMQADVIDQYCVFVYPVLLGSGKPLFTGGFPERRLRLMRTQAFGESGAVLLNYQRRNGR